ncbi:intraflagellar transport protein 88 homolog isoform X1 [Myzus persicae]|uniref:intraflagellar transport protein 88 homolog isoform X1 n=2 Tax=Myzus persicae TaxID=13164 RepID=UPI000B939E0A|nr:intraflagellar transport protein 88 homolog isoform X1 [Myzus persicae]
MDSAHLKNKFNAYDSDMYSQYDYHLDGAKEDPEEILRQALRSSYSRRASMSTKAPTGLPLPFATTPQIKDPHALVLRPESSRSGSESSNRPATAVRGAGYTSHSSTYDVLSQPSRNMIMSEPNKEERMEDKIKKLEKRIHDLVNDACMAEARGDFQLGLEKSKDASNKERSLIRMQEQAGLNDSHNIDLTFLVLFTLGNQYAANEMYTEALNTYQVISKNRLFQNGARMRVNVANIYEKIGQPEKAIKMYRMALDQVPNTNKSFKRAITHNIGVIFLKLGKYEDACSNFEYIMHEKPTFKAGMHALVCYYMSGNKDKSKQIFKQMLEISLDIDFEDKYAANSDEIEATLLAEAIKSDSLTKYEKQIKSNFEKTILNAAHLISSIIEDTFTEGYSWCLDTIKMSRYSYLAGHLEINKAVGFLYQNNIASAIDTLKAFDNKDSKVASAAATNLSFIHFLKGDLEQAERTSIAACETDSLNGLACVNQGNCFFVKQDYYKAKELYTLALEKDMMCSEAMYNLGLTNKHLGHLDDAMDCFQKLHVIISNHPEVIYQIALLNEMIGDLEQAIEWYLQLLSIVPDDVGVLQKLGDIYENINDKQQAYHYYYESYRHYPSNLEVLDWLGAYFVEMKVPEKAVDYFEQASLMQPAEPKWYMLIGSCYRRAGQFQLALQTYKDVLNKFPDNTECLKLLIRICTDLGLKEASEYSELLRKAEKAKDIRERISTARTGYRKTMETRGGTGMVTTSNTNNYVQKSTASGETNIYVHDSPKDSGMVSDSSQRPRTSRGGTAVITTSMPLTSAYSRQNISDEMNIYVHPEPKLPHEMYSDPLGPLQRPRTSTSRPITSLEKEFADEQVQDLLPE